MRDLDKNQIFLTERFPYQHQDLERLQKKLSDSNASTWGDLQDFDFLCIDMRQTEAPFVEQLGMIQQVFAEKNYDLLPSHCSNFSPQTKMMSYSMEFLAIPKNMEIDFDQLSLEMAHSQADLLLRQAIGLNSPIHRYYCVNKIVSEYLSFLYFRNRSSNILECLIELFKKSLDVAKYLTILDLPPTKFDSADHRRLIPVLFEMCPQLKWLSLDPYDHILQIENDFVRHEGLRVLKIEGLRLSLEQEGQLRELFPNLEILEG